jgi:hypothetical protein
MQALPLAIHLRATYGRLVYDSAGKEACEVEEIDLVIPRPRTFQALRDASLVYHAKQTHIHRLKSEEGFSLFQLEYKPRRASGPLAAALDLRV